MKRTTLIICFFCILFLSLFYCCTNKYSNPYSVGYVASELSKKYGIEIEIVKTEKSSKGNGNKYILKDKNRGIIFKAGSSVEMDRHIPLYNKEMWDDYQLDLMRHYHVDVLQLADKYGIYLKPPLSEDSAYNNGDRLLVWPVDSVFINSPEQLDLVVDLYTELAHLYSFTCVDPDYSCPHFSVCYSSANKDDSTGIVGICELQYLNYQPLNDKSQSYTSRKEDKYVYSFFGRYEVCNKFYGAWNERVDKGILAEKKARYKQYESKTLGVMDYDEKNNRYSGIINISGVPVKIHFLSASPAQITENISAWETIREKQLYNNYLRKSFTPIKNELEDWLKNTNVNIFEHIILKEESLTEQIPLHSIIFKKDGSMFVYYRIADVNSKLIFLSINRDGTSRGGGILSRSEVTLFDSQSTNLSKDEFIKIYTVFE